jgi:hypothetical protein
MLQQNALHPVAQRLFMKVETWIASEHDDLHRGMAFGDAMQVLSEVLAIALAPKEDDLGALQSHLSEQVRHSSTLGHDHDVVTWGQDLPHPGQEQWVVVGNGDIYDRFPRVRNEAFGPFSGGYLHFRPVGNRSLNQTQVENGFPGTIVVLKANFRPGFFYFQVKFGQY